MKGDETMKQIMKRGLKLFLVLCLMIESFLLYQSRQQKRQTRGAR